MESQKEYSLCKKCQKKIPVCTNCNSTLEKNSDLILNHLPFLSYWSENERYGRYVNGYDNGNYFCCKRCHKENDFKDFKKIDTIIVREVCSCEHHLEEICQCGDHIKGLCPCEHN